MKMEVWFVGICLQSEWRHRDGKQVIAVSYAIRHFSGT